MTKLPGELMSYRLMSWVAVCLAVLILILAGTDYQVFPLVFLAGKSALGNVLSLLCIYLLILRPMFNREEDAEGVGHSLSFLLAAWGVSLPFLLTASLVDNGRPFVALHFALQAWFLTGAFLILTAGFSRLLRGGYYPVMAFWVVGIPLSEYFLRELLQPTKGWGWWFYTPFGRIAANFYGGDLATGGGWLMCLVFVLLGAGALVLSGKIGAGAIQEKH